MFYVLLTCLLSIFLISKEYIYVSDEFIVILSFLIITSLFFMQLANVMSANLDEYSQKINKNAKDLVYLQQKVLLEVKLQHQDLLNLQVRIKGITAYILEELVEFLSLCEEKYNNIIDAYVSNKLIILLLLDIDYYEKIYLEFMQKCLENIHLLELQTVTEIPTQDSFFSDQVI
jgi:hypothetical protein